MPIITFSVPSLETKVAMAEAKKSLSIIATTGEVTNLVAYKCVNEWISNFTTKGGKAYYQDPGDVYNYAIRVIKSYIWYIQGRGVPITSFKQEACRQIARLDCLKEKFKKSRS